MIKDADLVRFVHEMSRDWAGAPQLGALYRQAVRGLLVPLGFDRASLHLYNPESYEVRGTWSTDEEGRVVDDSDHCSFIGQDREFLTEALAQADRVHIRENQSLSIVGKASVKGWTVTVLLQDGERTLGWLNVDNAFRHLPLTELEREVLALYGQTLSVQIQRQRFAELSRKLRRQNDQKDKLFAILTHDLRGPIGILSALLKDSRETSLSPDDLRKVLVAAGDASSYAYDLVDNLLGWVRSQLEGVEALRERVLVLRILTTVRVWLLASADVKGISLKIECPEALSVIADEKTLQTILRNLVSNAIKYSPQGSTVVLRARKEEDSIIVEIVDRGVGIEPLKLEELFLSQQADSEPGTHGERGHGLGLMFSKDLSLALGGRLEAESVVGEGSTFRLILGDEVDGEL